MKTSIDIDENGRNLPKFSELKLVYLTDPFNEQTEKNIGTYRLDLAK
jgi:hypothetical protein